jgi:hypothetical protein
MYSPRTLIEQSEAQEANVRELFQTFDCDKNGRIDIDEVHDLLRLVRHTRASHNMYVDCTETAREKDEAMLRALPRLVPEYSRKHGLTFNQFIYFYNHVLHLSDDQAVHKSINEYVEKNKKTRNYKNHEIVNKQIEQMIKNNSDLTEAQKNVLQSIEHGTIGFASDEEERDIAEKKLKISSLLNLYAKTNSKMQFSHFKRELAELTIMIETASNAAMRLKDQHWRRDLLHGQGVKEKSNHYEFTGQISPMKKRSQLTSIASESSGLKNEDTEEKEEHEINYLALTRAANAFMEGHDRDFKIKLTPAITDALKEHILDLGTMRALPQQLRDYALKLVDEKNLYAVFAFYKFSNDDRALASYLKFRMGKSLAEKQRDRRQQELKLIHRAASYEQFLQERKDIYDNLRKEIETEKKQKVVDAISPKKTTRKKPRWLKLYEDAAKKKMSSNKK